MFFDFTGWTVPPEPTFPTCKTCLRDYPHTEWRSGFECWGCKELAKLFRPQEPKKSRMDKIAAPDGNAAGAVFRAGGLVLLEGELWTVLYTLADGRLLLEKSGLRAKANEEDCTLVTPA